MADWDLLELEDALIAVHPDGRIVWNEMCQLILGHPVVVQVMLDAAAGRLGLRRINQDPLGHGTYVISEGDEFYVKANSQLEGAGYLPAAKYEATPHAPETEEDLGVVWWDVPE